MKADNPLFNVLNDEILELANDSFERGAEAALESMKVALEAMKSHGYFMIQIDQVIALCQKSIPKKKP